MAASALCSSGSQTKRREKSWPITTVTTICADLVVLDASASGDGSSSFGWVLVAGLFLYFLPTIVASLRHHQAAPVFVLNLFLGWTFIGWVVALAIAVGTSAPASRPVEGPLSSPENPWDWIIDDFKNWLHRSDEGGKIDPEINPAPHGDVRTLPPPT